MKLYQWQGYTCAYDRIAPPVGADKESGSPPLLLIHPIGVGLSRWFWTRFIQAWHDSGQLNTIYNPDLLGCGESELPRIAYYPEDWGRQLQQFVSDVIQEPVIVVAQGALCPVALSCAALFPEQVRAIALSGPPAWRLMTNPTDPAQQKLAWNLFNTPLGSAFYQYARRRQFLASFSERQLFGDPAEIDEHWLDQLQAQSQKAATRHAVFAFLAGFWRQNYQGAIAAVPCPTLVVFGEQASSITKGYVESAEQRLGAYLEHLPHAEGCQIPGRNVLPYESTTEFVQVLGRFVNALS